MMRFLFDKINNHKLSIRFTVVTVFIFATLATAAFAVMLQFFFMKNMATDAAETQFNSLAERAGQYLDAVDVQASQIAKILASNPYMVQDDWASADARDLFAEAMRNNPLFYAIYLGFPNGDFYELINLDSSTSVRQLLGADAENRWVMITIFGEGSERIRRYDYFDADFVLQRSREESSDYNATRRPWFIQAERNKVNKSAPYMFHNLQAPGQTYSTLVQGSGAVLAVDIALSSLSSFLTSQRVSTHQEVYLYQKTGEMIAAANQQNKFTILPASLPLELTPEEKQVVAANKTLVVSNEMDWAPIDYAISGRPYGYSKDFLSLISDMTGINFKYVNGFTWNELLSSFDNKDIDILQPVFKNQQNQHKGLFSDSFLTLPYSLVTLPGKAPVSHLNQIDGWSVAIPEGWSIIQVIRTHFPKIKIVEVDSTRGIFDAVLNEQADAGLDVGAILHYTAQRYFLKRLQFHDNLDFSPVEFPQQLHFVTHKDKPELLALINRAIANVSEQQQVALADKWLNPRQQIMTDSGTVPYADLIKIAQQPRLYQSLHLVTIRDQLHYIYATPVGHGRLSQDFFAIVIPVDDVLAPVLDKVALSIMLTIGGLLLLMPLPWLSASPIVKPIKQLADENEKIIRQQYRQVRRPLSRIKEIDELGRSMVVMSESIEQYIQNQKALMDSFIQIIAEAIDEKSPYTGAHCLRVPELAFMLVEKAEQSDATPFKDFAFHTEAEWREFKVAAWLHDCGKITTPEYIVDKGTKLETIYNRIHEIRTRFELLWRDAEIDYWKQLVSRPENERQYRQEMESRKAKIREDFDFVAKMNIGGEFLGDEQKQRLKAIAEQTWVRHLSDRIGLSPLEETRLQGEEPALPVKEKLLADKPEHLIERDHKNHYEPHLGIKMAIPEYLYNQGELYNLLIERGTLTAEDRFKINEHTISTIKMLDRLPLPPELARVPRYASTHHETMKGTGYPRKLSGDDLSIPERIMVLADIFEALTASDRPYKKAKTVSTAIDILYQMVQDEHIDADVFELFLSSGVYLDYAQRFLPEAQIDEVDVSLYLRRH